MLGVKTCRAERIGAQPLSQCAGPGQPGGMACRGWPSGCMLGDGARGSATFDPQSAWAPFCDVICIGSIDTHGRYTYNTWKKKKKKKVGTSEKRHPWPRNSHRHPQRRMRGGGGLKHPPPFGSFLFFFFARLFSERSVMYEDTPIPLPCVCKIDAPFFSSVRTKSVKSPSPKWFFQGWRGITACIKL